MKKIGILIVAYNAAATLESVLDRIPVAFGKRVTKVVVNDDCSRDATYLVGLGYQQISDLPLEVIRNPKNLGYGGNQKSGYRWAIEHGLDIVVLLHGDGQYAPELLPEMVEPLERGDCDAVLGSRTMEKGAARRGGMPLYKFLGNRILTTFQNRVAGLQLSEWHSGYRAYSVAALKEIPFERNPDGFDFDTHVILQLHEAEKEILEIPIPTYYGDEICYVNGLRYAWDVTRAVVRYRAHKAGFGSGELAFSTSGYDLKDSNQSSHGKIVGWLRHRPPSRILDLGCGDGRVGELLRACGHEVTGVDREKHTGVAERLDGFVEADLESGIPRDVGDRYDVVIAADVLEHTRSPAELLAEIRRVVAQHGTVIISIPNFGHWYPRIRVATGRFDYDQRGILDRGHVRFFTRRSFERLAAAAGFTTRRWDATGLPLEVLGREPMQGSTHTGSRQLLRAVDQLAVKSWPSLFAYQLLYELEPLES